MNLKQVRESSSLISHNMDQRKKKIVWIGVGLSKSATWSGRPRPQIENSA